MTTSFPFVLEVQPQAGGCYAVRAEFQGAVWQAEVDAALPLLTPEEKQESALWIERDLLDRASARDLGTRLFYSLFPPVIHGALRTAVAMTANAQHIRLTLNLPAELSALPWELLYDPDEGRGFLARSASVSVVRWVPGSTRPHTPPASLPIRVLVVVASPSKLPKLGGEDELTSLRAMLYPRTPNLLETTIMVARQLWRRRGLTDLASRLRNRTFVEIELLLHATRRDLQKAFIDARSAGHPFHVVHFIGHCDADEESGAAIVLEAEDSGADFVSADDFAEIVAEPSVVLVFLNACCSAMPLHRYQSVAHALLQRGVNGVLGMQTDMLDRAAIVLAEEFYGAWAAGLPLEQALAYARRLMASEYRTATAGWIIPVLSMRSVDGVPLSVDAPPWRWPDPLRRLYRAGALLVAALTILLVLVNSASLFNDIYQRWQEPTYSPMPDIFNVAVVNPGIIKGQANEKVRYAATFLADQVYKRLEESVNQSILGDFAAVHRVNTEVIPITDEQTHEDQMADLAAQMADLAEQLRADVVIYGMLDAAQYSPAFYVSPRLTGAEESTGQQALGAAITLTLPLLPNSDGRLDLIEEFIPRVQVLSQLVLALGLFKVGNYEASLAHLGDLQAMTDWQDDEGKEILYLWLGTNHFRLGLSPKDGEEKPLPVECSVPQSSATDYLTCARAAYEQADAIFQNTYKGASYARAAIGLGNYWLTQNWVENGDQRIHICQFYEVAVEQYNRVLDAASTTNSRELPDLTQAFPELKAKYNIGTAFATGFRNGCDPQDRFYAEAVSAFTTTLEIYTQSDRTAVSQDIAARASYQLGVIHRQASHSDLAIEAFQQVLEISSDPQDEAEEWQAIGWKARVQLGHIYAAYARERSRPWWQTWGSLTADWRRALAYYDQVIEAKRSLQFGRVSGRDQEDEVIFVADAYTGRGAVLNLRQDYIAAEVALKEAIRLLEADVSEDARSALTRLPWTSYLEQGRAYTGQQRWNEAVAAYARITDDEFNRIPDDLVAEANLATGLIYHDQGNRAAAERHYNAVLELARVGDPLNQTATKLLQELESE